jgi:hypothetical protein
MALAFDEPACQASACRTRPPDFELTRSSEAIAVVHDREDLFEDDFEFDDDFEDVGEFEDDFYEDADDDADDDDDDVLWEEADDSDAPSRRSSAAKTPGKRGKADAPRSDSAAKHKNGGKAEPKPPRGKGAKNSKPAGGKKQPAKSGTESGEGKERAGDAADRSGGAAPKPRHEAAARGDSDAKSRTEGAKPDRKERSEPEKKGRASGPKQTPATTRPGGGEDAGSPGPATFAAELYAADDDLLDNEVDETTEEEVARPTGPQADHLVHIYEFGQLKRTIPRKFTDEQAVSFAEEYTRTGKPYGRLAVAMPDDEQPAQSFADAARG